MRKSILAAGAALAFLSSAALAQTAAPTTVPTTTTTTTANSAKAQIEASGYSDVKDLRRQDDGSWLARATKNNVEVALAVDSNGNVTQIAR